MRKREEGSTTGNVLEEGCRGAVCSKHFINFLSAMQKTFALTPGTKRMSGERLR